MSSEGQTAIQVVASILFVLSLIGMYFSLKNLKTNTSVSIGVISDYSKWAQFAASIFVAYLPVSLVWLGLFLTMITAQHSFLIPTLASGLTCIVLLLTDLLTKINNPQ
jgi:uncharacterized membrane protein YedE/YeeE